ncbi:MAG: hypothetical protein KGJ35_00210 [Patescibacteria group bacterium]|nr:hypothetical protein [Patescibacteria group bacterium]
MNENGEQKPIEHEKALRTLEGDIQEAIQKKNASAASMVLSEKRVKSNVPAETNTESQGSRKKIFITIMSIALVLMGLGGAYVLYLYSPLSVRVPTVPQQTAVPSIFGANEQKTLDFSGLNRGGVQTAVKNVLSKVGTNTAGSILQIIPVTTDNGSTANGKPVATIVPITDFLTMTGMSVPDILFRSLDTNWMLGVYNDNGTAAPFIVLSDNFFQNAYAGMISWEKGMPDNLSLIFPSVEQPVISGTSTVAQYFDIQGTWKDGVISNKDIRLFTRQDGNELIMYSFVDPGIIVITTDSHALSEIINRLEKQSFTR